jgi:hypothetical protein
MSFDLTALLPFSGVFGPIVQQLSGALIQHIAPSEVKATSVADYVEMKKADNETAKVRADLENGGGQTYPWVWAVLKMQRPTVVMIVMALWVLQELTSPSGATSVVQQSAGFVISWLFCERFVVGDGIKKR